MSVIIGKVISVEVDLQVRGPVDAERSCFHIVVSEAEEEEEGSLATE
jgi:hypothetical protein